MCFFRVKFDFEQFCFKLVQTLLATTMSQFKGLSFAVLLLYTPYSISQIAYSNGATVSMTNGCIVHCNGGIRLAGNSSFNNEGDLTVTKLSTLPQQGNYMIDAGSTASGSGNYRVEQDWINDGTFTADGSTVYLYGNTEQLITSTNGTVTIYNNLTLTGTGTNTNRKKSLLNVDAEVGQNGVLNLTDRELSTDVNSFYVRNSAPNSIVNSTTYGSEGFVSSLTNGYLFRETSSSSGYLFPVGSSVSTLRYRPVNVQPTSAADHQFAARLNNYLADADNYLLAQKEPLIENANTNFYHSIERTSGSSDASISVYFDPATDGDWKGLANWNSTEALWKVLDQASATPQGNYSAMTKSSWNFSNEHPYILTDPADLLIIPTAFTPDQDAVHDTWSIPYLDQQYPNNIVRIYNRWGNLLFEHDSKTEGPYEENEWNGTYEGNDLPVASYYFIIDFNDDEKRSATGIVTIVKEKEN